VIRYYFENTPKIKRLDTSVKKWIKNVIEINGKSVGSINYVFCDNEYLLEFNKKYLNHYYFTDVITFDYNQKEFIAGDIFISIDMVRENSMNHKVDFIEELLRVMVHGILHLLGFGDKNRSEKNKMRQMENKCLEMFFNNK
jgi:rRNA maturation RNase YbeY